MTDNDIKKRLQTTLRGMKSRCYNKKHQDWKYYGGKGVEVCIGWHKSRDFINWALQTGYRMGLTIDRINSDGNYEPANCRWVTRDDQAKNRKYRPKLYSHDGTTLAAREWANKLGISELVFGRRKRAGLVGEALFSPNRNRNRACPLNGQMGI